MSPRSISLIILTLLIACLGVAFLRVVQPFLLPLLLAAVTAMLLQPLQRYFMCRTSNRTALSALLTTSTLLACLLIPLSGGMLLGAIQLYDWSSDIVARSSNGDPYHKVYTGLRISELVHRLQPLISPDAKPEEFEASATQMVRDNLPKLLENVANQTLGLAASTFGLLGSIVSMALTLGVYITAVYFFLADGTHMLESAKCMIPVQRDHQERLLDQFVKVTRAVVVGTFAAAIAQGLATGVGLYFAGIDRVILLTVVATLMAVVPIASTSLVWIPCAIWMVFGRENAAIPVVVFSLYNIVVVGSLDNIIRSYVLNSDVKLHPLLAFISVLGGLQWMGLWGVFIGPVVASCLYALASIINEELAQLAVQNGHQQAAPTTAEAMAAVANEAGKAVANALTAPSPPPAPASVVVKVETPPGGQVGGSKRQKRRS